MNLMNFICKFNKSSHMLGRFNGIYNVDDERDGNGPSSDRKLSGGGSSGGEGGGEGSLSIFGILDDIKVEHSFASFVVVIGNIELLQRNSPSPLNNTFPLHTKVLYIPLSLFLKLYTKRPWRVPSKRWCWQ